MRLHAQAILFLVLNLTGLVLGPKGVGGISDMIVPALGVQSRESDMVAISLESVASTFLFLFLKKTGFGSETKKLKQAEITWPPPRQ